METKTHPYYKEVMSLFTRLGRAGFRFEYVNDGEDKHHLDTTLERVDGVGLLVDAVLSVDMSMLRVENPAGGKNTLFLVLGNNPGELVCDYTYSPDFEGNQATIDSIVDAHYEEWDGDV